MREQVAASPARFVLLVTGANGYIGRELVRQALACGWAVCALGRRRDGLPVEVEFLSWTLGEPLPTLPDKWRGYSLALVHLAHDWNAHGGHVPGRPDLNVEGALCLWRSATEGGVGRLVFVSSLSARADAPNYYGRAKWAAEQTISSDLAANSVCARVGLVYGGPSSAMYGLLCKLVGLPFLPMVCLRQRVQPIGLDEVAAGLLRLASSEVKGIVGLAASQPITFRQFLMRLSALLGGTSALIIPVPLTLALFGCRMTGYLPLLPTVDPERVLGLSGTRTRDTVAELASIALEVREFGNPVPSLRLGYRALLLEGRAVIGQVLGCPPSAGILRKYVRLVTRCRNARPLGLPRHVLAFPWLLRWREPLSRTCRLSSRLRLALRLVDASREGAQRFQSTSGQGDEHRLVIFARLGFLGWVELILFVCRLVWPLRVSDE